MMLMENPFVYSFNEKRYHTFNYYLKTTYGKKVSKVMLDGGFTCPNRDGTKGIGGCIFCSAKGSGDSNLFSKESILEQYRSNKALMDRKWPNGFYIPYFQSFSNTYGPLAKIKEMIEPFLKMDEVCEIAIATRCDCLEDEVLDHLAQVNQIKPIWLEIGLQSASDRVGEIINRKYTFDQFQDALHRCEERKIRTCVHIMNGLPFENKEDMLQTVKTISRLPFSGIKVHMLHVLKDTALARMYEEQPFELISRDEYIELVVRQLELLDPKVIIQRLTGDPLKDELLAPGWVLNKTTILNDIDKLMRKLDTYQGARYEQ